MFKIRIILILCWVLFQNLEILGQENKAFFISEEKEFTLPLYHLNIVADSLDQYEIDDFLNNETLSIFKTLDKNTNYQSSFTYWAKLQLKSNLPHDTKWVFYPHGYGNPRTLDVFIVDEISGEIIHKRSGYDFSLREKDIPEIRNGKVSFLIDSGVTLDIYVRITTKDGYLPKFKPIIQPYHQFEKLVDNRNLLQGFFQGILWVMLLYNFIIFLISRDNAYLHYSLYTLFIALYFAHFHGLSEEIIFPEFPLVNKQLITTASLGAVFYFTFMRSFLDSKSLIPKWDKMIILIIVLNTLAIIIELVLSTIQEYFLMVRVMNIAVLLECVTSIFMIVILIRTKDKKAMYFVVGSLLLWITVPVGVMGYIIYEYKGIVSIIQVGIVMEILLFALGLGYRFKANEKEKRQAQEALIAQLKENEELQSNLNKELEEKVKKRTEALEKQKEELAYQKEEILAQRDLVERQKEYLEHANMQIKSSINYAQRIQDAILPPVEKIKAILPDIFVMLKPRDVVSGDFYWFGIKEDKIIIAAADCTGHGVPGGFMSMISHSLLNQIILDKGILEPGKILDRLNIGIWKALKQSETKNRDGMDISICVIDPDNKKMEVACAKNPFLYVQPNGSGLKNTVIKGDKMSVGGWTKQKIKLFTTHSIDLSIPTSIYMYSDGYQDQFGGHEGTKFFAKRFRDLLFDNSHQPIEKQHENLETSLQLWMQDNGKLFPEKQVDDILVIGAKLEF